MHNWHGKIRNTAALATNCDYKNKFLHADF